MTQGHTAMHDNHWIIKKASAAKASFWEPRRQISRAITIGLMVTGAALLFNVSHQCAAYSKTLAARANIAVFLQRDASARADDIRQQIKAVPGIKHLYLVTPEESLASALKDSPELSALTVTGNNPFSAYFLVYPQQALPAEAKRLKETLGALPDVEDVRADDRLFAIVETLDAAGEWYRTGLAVIAAGFIVLVIIRFIQKWSYSPLSLQRAAAAAAVGLTGGALAIGIAALMMHYSPAGLAPLPFSALWLCLPAGMILGMHQDKNQ